MPTYNNLPATTEYSKGKLYNRMVEDLRLAGNAKRTVYGYVRAVRKLADFCQTTPDQVDEEQLSLFLLHQIVKKELASGTQSVLLSRIKSSTGTPARVTGKFSTPRNFATLEPKLGHLMITGGYFLTKCVLRLVHLSSLGMHRSQGGGEDTRQPSLNQA